MRKTAYFFVDDVIWCFRDLTRTKPKSIFDVPFLAMLKRVHDKYGLKVQLNLFYRTDFFYGNDEFTLAEVPDTYKPEFEANSDWLKMAFHAKQEFPDYPYVNADYEDVKSNFLATKREILRFAGEGSLSHSVCPHWLPISREGCQALADCGVKFISPSSGDRREYDGNPDSLPYGHAFRLLQNRKPETMIFTRNGKNKAIANSLCGYNHISAEQMDSIKGRNLSILDKETGIRFRQHAGGPSLNRHTLKEIEEKLNEMNDGREFIGCGTHEQYFYEDYFAYQPDYAEKVYLLAKKVTEFGYTWVTADELK